ncbi:MAG TPA: HAD-IIIA family hydrolase [Polyangiaceae bacterium]|nr:HAD-IIIA family hydrolase [Polyangiaceae bacterium]
MTRVAIFDRDATLIDVVRDEETGTIAVAFHPDQIRLLPGAVDGMRTLADAGFVLAIATNQPGPAKGQISARAVERTNGALVELLVEQGIRVAGVEVCMHHPEGGPGGDPSLVMRCDCRKPKAGMLRALLSRFDGEAAASWMIGDSQGDVQAGKAAGMRTGLVFATNRCELCPLRPQSGGYNGETPDAHAGTVLDLAREIVAAKAANMSLGAAAESGEHEPGALPRSGEHESGAPPRKRRT